MNGRSTAPGRGAWSVAVVGGASALVLVWCCVRSPVDAGGVGRLESPGGSDSAPGAPADTDPATMGAGLATVAAGPPDPRLLALDPALVDGHERELRVQIASTVVAPELAPRLSKIAQTAHEPATRIAAVDALGRIGTREAQSELLSLLPALPAGDDARRQIVPLLRPHALDDEWAAQLAAQLDAATLTSAEKKQLAFTLALVGLRDGMRLPDGTVSPAARQLIADMTALAQRGAGGQL